MTRAGRLSTACSSLRCASLHLDTALEIARDEDVPFLTGDLPRVQEMIDMLAVALREYRKGRA